MNIKVCVDCLFLIPDRNRGTLTYTTEILRNWALEGKKILIICNKRNIEYFRGECKGQGVTYYCPNISGDNRLVRVLYQQWMLNRVATRNACDVVYSPGYIGKTFGGVPSVVTIHDMQYVDIPGSIPFGMKVYYHSLLPLSAYHAKKILTVSKFSKQQIAKHLKLAKHKVSVVYESSQFEEHQSSVYRMQGQYRYVLSVSSSAKHKNIDKLIEAFLQLSQNPECSDVKLVLIGQHMNWGKYRDISNKMEKDNKILSLGYIDTISLRNWYANATAFVLCSHYEGFGLPVLEAMQMGAPVVCSRVASLTEVGGDAVQYCDPSSSKSISDALWIVLTDPKRAAELRDKGIARSKMFSWKSAAQDTWKELEAVATEYHAAGNVVEYEM